MCNCKNVTFGGYQNQLCLPRPKHMIGRREGSYSETICVDACLKSEIEHLWSLGISTTGCCCGHNIEPIFAFIGVVDNDIPKMISLRYEVQANETDLTRCDSFKPKSIYGFGNTENKG